MARRLQQELNRPPLVDQDLQLALAMYADTNEVRSYKSPFVVSERTWQEMLYMQISDISPHNHLVGYLSFRVLP